MQSFREQQGETRRPPAVNKAKKQKKKIGDIRGKVCAKMGTTKDRIGKDLVKAEEIKQRWQEYREELFKKDLNDPDNHDSQSLTQNQIFQSVKSSGPQETLLPIKLVEVMEFQQNYFKS